MSTQHLILYASIDQPHLGRRRSEDKARQGKRKIPQPAPAVCGGFCLSTELDRLLLGQRGSNKAICTHEQTAAIDQGTGGGFGTMVDWRRSVPKPECKPSSLCAKNRRAVVTGSGSLSRSARLLLKRRGRHRPEDLLLSKGGGRISSAARAHVPSHGQRSDCFFLLVPSAVPSFLTPSSTVLSTCQVKSASKMAVAVGVEPQIPGLSPRSITAP